MAQQSHTNLLYTTWARKHTHQTWHNGGKQSHTNFVIHYPSPNQIPSTQQPPLSEPTKRNPKTHHPLSYPVLYCRTKYLNSSFFPCTIIDWNSPPMETPKTPASLLSQLCHFSTSMFFSFYLSHASLPPSHSLLKVSRVFRVLLRSL